MPFFEGTHTHTPAYKFVYTRPKPIKSWGLMFKDLDFKQKPGIGSNPEQSLRQITSDVQQLCVHLTSSAFVLYIPISMELSTHVGVLVSSLTTTSYKCAN